MERWLSALRWDVWEPLPSWAKWTFAVWVDRSIDAVRMCWGERRFVGGYFEALVADFIFAGIPLLAVVFGIIAGCKAYERTQSKILGWVVGFAVLFAIGSIRFFAEEIPGVGWRIEKMQEAHDLAEDLQ